MKLLVVFLSICALALGGVIPKLDGRIIGGSETTIENHPYQISLHYLGSHSCGGSIINRNTILTASHCVDGVSARDLTVRVGSTDKRTGELFNVDRFIMHPDYNREYNYNNDVAIIQLSRPLTFSDRVQPIELQPANSPVRVGTTALVSGWGTTIPGVGAFPNRLRVVDVEVISNNDCEDSYEGEEGITETMLCTQTIDQDSCQGDSGGPLAANGRLIGVVSWGYGCADIDYPGVYAKVSNLRDFIDQYL